MKAYKSLKFKRIRKKTRMIFIDDQSVKFDFFLSELNNKSILQ